MEVNMQAVFWLAFLVLMLAGEAATLGLTSIWFAGGALAAFVCAMAGTDLLVQLIVFCAVSGLLLLTMRPAASKWLNKDRIRTNAGSLIGKTAVVTEKIDNLAGTGEVQVRGQEWTARTEQEGVQIPEGAHVKIQKISGVKLIVKEESDL